MIFLFWLTSFCYHAGEIIRMTKQTKKVLTQFPERVRESLCFWHSNYVSCYNTVTRSASYNIYRLLSYKTRYSNFIQNKEDQHKFFKPENKSSFNLIIILGCYGILFLLNWTSAPHQPIKAQINLIKQLNGVGSRFQYLGLLLLHISELRL